jgi:hypothetical protein
MRWLMIAMFVSVVLLLAVSAGMMRHVWRAHKQAEKEPAPPQEEETEVSTTEEGQ